MRKPNQLKLGIDLDGVAANFHKSFSPICREICGPQMPVFPDSDPPMWDYPQHFGATEEQMAKVWRQIRESESFWADLDAYPGVPEALADVEALTQQGHEAYFLTLRSGVNSKRQSEHWLQEFGISNPTVLITPNGKARLAFDLGLTHVIDDYPVMLKEYMLHRSALKPYPKVYLLERAYNLDSKKMPLMVVNSLQGFVDSARKDI